MKLLGPCTLTQAALPYIFENVPQSYHQRSMDIFERNATICYQMLEDVPGISPIMPAGAMYMMVSDTKRERERCTVMQYVMLLCRSGDGGSRSLPRIQRWRCLCLSVAHRTERLHSARNGKRRTARLHAASCLLYIQLNTFTWYIYNIHNGNTVHIIDVKLSTSLLLSCRYFLPQVVSG